MGGFGRPLESVADLATSTAGTAGGLGLEREPVLERTGEVREKGRDPEEWVGEVKEEDREREVGVTERGDSGGIEPKANWEFGDLVPAGENSARENLALQ